MYRTNAIILVFIIITMLVIYFIVPRPVVIKNNSPKANVFRNSPAITALLVR